jgi:DNA-binding protein Fis
MGALTAKCLITQTEAPKGERVRLPPMALARKGYDGPDEIAPHGRCGAGKLAKSARQRVVTVRRASEPPFAAVAQWQSARISATGNCRTEREVARSSRARCIPGLVVPESRHVGGAASSQARHSAGAQRHRQGFTVKGFAVIEAIDVERAAGERGMVALGRRPGRRDVEEVDQFDMRDPNDQPFGARLITPEERKALGTPMETTPLDVAVSRFRDAANVVVLTATNGEPITDQIRADVDTAVQCIRELLPASDVADVRTKTLAEAEREHINAVLARLHGHRNQAAEALGISASVLTRKLQRIAVEEVDEEEKRKAEEDAEWDRVFGPRPGRGGIAIRNPVVEPRETARARDRCNGHGCPGPRPCLEDCIGRVDGKR